MHCSQIELIYYFIGSNKLDLVMEIMYNLGIGYTMQQWHNQK
jgi:hypothetical protein